MTRRTPRVCHAILLGVLYLLITVLHPAWSSTVLAQERTDDPKMPEHIRFDHLSTESGLASSKVDAIVQDSDGFMWFGTAQGLNRFDSYEFTLFGANPNQPRRDIGRNRILSLLATPDDRLWVGTDYLVRYDIRTATLDRFHVSNGDGISALVMDQSDSTRQGKLWLGGYQFGLRLFDPEQRTLEAVYTYIPQTDHEWRDNTINAIAQADDGTLWLATPLGLYKFLPDTNDGVFERIVDEAAPQNTHISSITIDSQQRVWIGTWKGLYRYADGVFTHYAEPQIPFTQIHSIFADSQDRVWIGSDKQGIAVYDPVVDDFIHYPSGDNNPYRVGPGAVFEITEDQEQAIWFAVQGYGVYRYNPSAQFFDLYAASPGTPDSLGYPQVLSLVADGQENAAASTIWVATDGGGLYALDQATNQFTAYQHDPDDTNSLSSDSVIGLARDNNGDIWIGSWAGGLSRLDPETETFTHWRADNSGLWTDNIFTLFADSHNQLWISAWDNGLQVLDIDRGEIVQSFRGSANVGNGLRNISVMAMVESRDGSMWFAGYSGVEHYDPITGEFRQYVQEDEQASGLSSSTAFALHEDDEGLIWIGTDAGLNRLDPQTGEITYFTMGDGLPSSSIVGILEDTEGDLWLSTKHGVSLFRRNSMTFQNFSASDGLQANEFNRFSAMQAGGLMYFGGANGFNRFDPLVVKRPSQEQTARIVLTDFLLANQPVRPSMDGVLQQVIGKTSTVTLAPNDDVFSIKFAALEYTRPAQMRYRYQLQGFDETWLETNSQQRIATYTGLSPGNYQFVVQSINPDGSIAPTEATVELVLLPHWWETRTFYALIMMAAVVLLYIGYRLRVHSVMRTVEMQQSAREAEIYRLKNEELYELNQQLVQLGQEKDDLLGVVAHDLRNPLAGMMMNIDLLIQHSDTVKPEKQLKWLRRLDSTTRTMHNIANQLLNGQENGRLVANLKSLQLSPILQDLSHHYEAFAANKHIHIKQSYNHEMTVVADDTMLRQVLDNLLSNALKYSDPHSTVTISVEQQTQVLEIALQDEGQGMSKADLEQVFGRYTQLSAKPTLGEESVGLGLYNVKKLMSAMNGSVTAHSAGIGQGSTFIVTLPVG
ncbi:MAG: two-component regulator propeller domain-containing protein [Chloroflexota bacterium]